MEEEREIVPFPEEPVTPVAQAISKPKHRRCTGARLGNRRYEVEDLLQQGFSKRKIARMLEISDHVVRAVAEDPAMRAEAERYAPVSRGNESTPLNPAVSIPDTLRSKAMLAVGHITDEKLKKSTPQACALVADKLLKQASSLEDQRSGIGIIADVFQQMGIQASHSASRLVVRETKEVELTTEQHT